MEITGDLADQATDVFGDEQTAADWFAQPHPWLDGQLPSDLLHNQRGVEIVRDLLGRMKYGIYC